MRESDATSCQKSVRFHNKPQIQWLPSRACGNYVGRREWLPTLRAPNAKQASPAAVASTPKRRPKIGRWWLIDTGCPYDLAGIEGADENNIEEREVTVELDTAKGLAEVNMVVPTQIQLGEKWQAACS